LFSRQLPPFSYLKIAFFFQKGAFCRGKAPFIFDQNKFISAYNDTLQESITSVIDPVKLSKLARENGFLQRQSKLKPEEFVDTLISSGFDHSQLSLQECCNDLAQQHHKSLSKVALHNRFNENSLKFLKSILAGQITSRLHIGEAGTLQPFTKVLIADSSKFSIPAQYTKDYPGFGGWKNGSALMNIQYAFDLKEGNWENLELTKATQNDQSHSKRTLNDIKSGELHIRDLGFVTMGYLTRIVSEKAFFLNRLHPQFKTVQCNTGKAIDWTKLYQKAQDNRYAHFTTNVVIGTGKEAFECRLIAVPVADKVWSERIRKAEKHAKSKGVSLSKEYKERCRFSLFITNVEEQILKAVDVIRVYRLRWQIELVFKTWKSLLGIQKVKAVNKTRFECQLIARFIWILMNWKIFKCLDMFIQENSPGYACSMWKFFKQARAFGHALRRVYNGSFNFKDWSEMFIFPIVNRLLIEPKKGKKAAFQIANEIFIP